MCKDQDPSSALSSAPGTCTCSFLELPEPQAPRGGCGDSPSPPPRQQKSPAASSIYCHGNQSRKLLCPSCFLISWPCFQMTELNRELNDQGRECGEHSLQHPGSQHRHWGAGVELETRGEWTAPGPNRVSGPGGLEKEGLWRRKEIWAQREADIERRAGERAAHKTGWRRAARIVSGELRRVNVTEVVGKGSRKGSRV